MEQKRLTQFQEQQKTKPDIEAFISENLEGDASEAVLDFITHLRSNHLPPKWSSWNGWKSKYKGRCICSVNLPLGIYDTHTWNVMPNLVYMDLYEESIINVGLQQMIWDNVFYCVHDKKSSYSGKGCSPDKACAGGSNRMILGKEIRGICRCRPNPIFCNPDKTTIEGIKRLLEFEQMTRKAL